MDDAEGHISFDRGLSGPYQGALKGGRALDANDDFVDALDRRGHRSSPWGGCPQGLDTALVFRLVDFAAGKTLSQDVFGQV
ncbi:MAG TPA: hypothetical protein VKD67_01945 [Acidimicrobiales bacterium]|nr:hypothetical protein [Acidimicrobiales bacterium]